MHLPLQKGGFPPLSIVCVLVVHDLSIMSITIRVQLAVVAVDALL
jgi:hypothetical protein